MARLVCEVEAYPGSHDYYNLLIDGPSGEPLRIVVSRDALFERIQEHVNNRLRRLCNDVELERKQRTKSERT